MPAPSSRSDALSRLADAGRGVIARLEARAAQADDRVRAAEIERDAARDAVREARQRYGAR